ncbi:sulfotransferase 1B1-like [Littorina saxatilis]|uniref:Sulfotransferase domain-containing protein n=1 Tax=Littorina saxatilis TaxID=31220 RepID=A0AAN9BK58_9CAEN
MCEPSVIKDRSGVPFYYGDAKGVWFPPFPLPYPYSQQLDVIKNTVIRDDDVIMTGYGKSGSHWHYEMLSMLCRGQADYVKSDKPTEMLDRLTADQAAALPSPRVLNTHVPFHWLPTQALEKKTKIVYLLRNPKDIAVSLHNHMRDWTALGYPGSWPDFLHLYMHTGVWCNRWFDNVRDWERQIAAHPDIPVHVAVYEEAIKDPVGHVIKLNDFLGLGRSRDLCEKIADACSFNKLKVASAEVKDDLFKAIWKEGSPGFYRKGQVGDWKNWFTKEQNEEFDALYKKEMDGCKLNVVFQL